MFRNSLVKMLAVVALAIGSTAAKADTFNWWYTGTGVSANGTLTTFGDASSPEAVISFTGQRNGDTILGLVPLATDGGFNYDNMIQSMFPFVNLAGILFDAGPGDAPSGHYNWYFDQGGNREVFYSRNGAINDQPVDVRFERQTQTSTVPEPQSYALALAGLFAGIFMIRRRKVARIR